MEMKKLFKPAMILSVVIILLAVVLTLTWAIGKLERRLRNSDH